MFLAAAAATSCASPRQPAKAERPSAVEGGARGASPVAPSPPEASTRAVDLGPAAVPTDRQDAVRALHARLGRLERRHAALHHPFLAEATPVVTRSRREARSAVDDVERRDDDDWRASYVRAWRELDDYEQSLRWTARQEGIRPRRVVTQPGGQLPMVDADPEVGTE